MNYKIATILTLLLLVVATYSSPQNSDQPQTENEVPQDEGMNNVSPNADESGDYFQGDIKFSPSSGIRNGQKNTKFRWPQATIPYYINPTFNAKQRQLILDAMAEYRGKTCIKFRPYQRSDKDYVVIKSNEKGCWSRVGREGKRQELNLSIPGCVSIRGTAIHELMHTIGFYHEQSRSDRDNYVEIKWNNIEPKHKHNFDKYNPTQVDAFGTGYDYGSIMHYSATAFSKSKNLPTIVAKGNRRVTIGQRRGLSATDIAKINRMYNC